VRSQVASDLPGIIGDPLRLRAVFDNILSNALKYTPGGGTVSIESHGMRAHALDGREAVSIGISDTGPGVPHAFRSRIFDKFFRLEDQHVEARPGARGAGIGLYMCRQIVELHGGEITCHGGAGGRGTRITVTLPVGARGDRIADDAVDRAVVEG
jgi:signal transduction histidine kinase